MTKLFAPALALVFVVALSSVQPVVAQPRMHPQLEQAQELIEDERYYDAFGKLATLIPALPPTDPNRIAAQYGLARVLLELDLHQSALRALDSIQVPVGHKLYTAKMRFYLQIQRAMPGDLATIERLSDAPETAHRPEDLDEIRFMLGRYHYQAGEHTKALERLNRIKITGKIHYLKARYLMGVIYVILNRAQPAVNAFKDILRYEKQVGSPSYFAKYEQLANMALGRLFFSIGKYDTAGRYYDQINEGTEAWLDSLFELGWTYFHLMRLDRVMGQLHTLNSPYFEDRYYPEARVLEALILFRTCRFNETLVVVQRFLRDYKPLRKELDAQLSGSRSDAEFYWYLSSLASDKEGLSVQLRRIFNVALSDRELQRMFALVAKLGVEGRKLEKLKRNTSAQRAAQALIDDLGRVRNVMISEAGAMARKRLARVREELTEIIRQGLRIKYESLKARRNSINGAVRVAMAKTAMAAMEPREEDSEHIVWPFDGGYWRDELGGYTYDIKSKCVKKHFPRGFKVSSIPTRAKDKTGQNKAQTLGGESGKTPSGNTMKTEKSSGKTTEKATEKAAPSDEPKTDTKGKEAGK